jgi:hypothetical protein
MVTAGIEGRREGAREGASERREKGGGESGLGVDEVDDGRVGRCVERVRRRKVM